MHTAWRSVNIPQRKCRKSTLARATPMRRLALEPASSQGDKRACTMDKSNAILLGLLLNSMCAAAHGQGCVTMLADVAGSVSIADTASATSDEWWPVQLLQCLPPRKILSLQSGAHTTLFFPASGAA